MPRFKADNNYTLNDEYSLDYTLTPVQEEGVRYYNYDYMQNYIFFSNLKYLKWEDLNFEKITEYKVKTQSDKEYCLITVPCAIKRVELVTEQGYLQIPETFKDFFDDLKLEEIK